MSDYKPIIYATFINRRMNKEITSIPVMSHMTLNKDIRQLCDVFDFEIEYRLSEKIDLHSHDFVEFYFMFNGVRFQIGCGFIEDLTSEVGPSAHKFKANGRDFLGQLFNLNFLQAAPVKQTTLLSFAEVCIKDSYLPKYLAFKGQTRLVYDHGAYQGTLTISELTDQKIAPVLQSTADEIFNTVYQDRYGRLVIYGRVHAGDTFKMPDGKQGVANVANPHDFVVNRTLYETGDQNVQTMTLKEQFSKVFSECKVFYTGGEHNLAFDHTPSLSVYNSEPRARYINQPEIRTFQTATLVTTPDISFGTKKDQLAASIIRKSNQNLCQIIIGATLPYHVEKDGSLKAYEVNQIWNISAPSHQINEPMRLVGVGYTQDQSSLQVQLLFVKRDTLC